MAAFRVTFRECIQDSQDYGSDDQHMVSRVFFSLDMDGKRIGDFYADLKQVVGSDFETDPIEVTSPHGYDGAFNHQGFTKVADEYFRSLVGTKGSAIRIAGRGRFRMRNCRYVATAVYDF